MNETLGEIIDGLIEKFDALREAFFNVETTAYLLKIDGELVNYTPTLQLLSGWWLEYSTFRGRFELKYAEKETNFGAKLTLSSHIAIGEDVYMIDKSEVVKPQGKKPYWKLVAIQTSEKFIIPV